MSAGRTAYGWPLAKVGVEGSNPFARSKRGVARSIEIIVDPENLPVLR